MSLPNVGLNIQFTPAEFRRAIFMQRLKDDGTANQIALADSISLTTIQGYVNKYNFASDVDTKWIITPLFYNPVPTLGEDNIYDEHTYFRKLKDGTYEIAFEFKDPNPQFIARMKTLVETYGSSMAVMFVDNNTDLICSVDGSYLKGLRIQNGSVQNYTPPGATVAICIVRLRLEAGGDANTLVQIDITGSAEVTDDADFYSLRDGTMTVTSPAVTGCTIDFDLVADERTPTAPNTKIEITGYTYSMFTFVSQADGDEETLAGAGSITDNGDGTVTINEAALLQAGETYDIEVSFPRYDFVSSDCVVPS